MAIAKKEALYWISCLLYGVMLSGVLLYIRFPGDKVRDYVERRIEENLPETSCTIAEIGYQFPVTIHLRDVRIFDEKNTTAPLYEDQLFFFEPVWKNPLRIFSLGSKAYGGTHTARMYINTKEKSLDFSDIEMNGVQLETIPFFTDELDRKITGIFDLTGTLRVQKDDFSLLAAEGAAAIRNGELGLKKPILELSILKIDESSVNFNMQEDALALSKGKVANKQLNASFAGDIALSQPWLNSAMEIKGGLVPQPALYQQKKQLKEIVGRMQKRYKSQSLPYNVRGTISRPTFTYGN